MTLQGFKNNLLYKSNMTFKQQKKGRKTMKEHSIKCMRGFLKQLNDEWIECKLDSKKCFEKENNLDKTLKELCKGFHFEINLK